MLLWLILSIGTALSLVVIAVFVAMGRAERRARDAFYLSLGYSEETVVGLRGPKGAVAAQLAQIRQTPDGSGLPATPDKASSSK